MTKEEMRNRFKQALENAGMSNFPFVRANGMKPLAAGFVINDEAEVAVFHDVDRSVSWPVWYGVHWRIYVPVEMHRECAENMVEDDEFLENVLTVINGHNVSWEPRRGYFLGAFTEEARAAREELDRIVAEWAETDDCLGLPMSASEYLWGANRPNERFLRAWWGEDEFIHDAVDRIVDEAQDEGIILDPADVRAELIDVAEMLELDGVENE